MRAATFLRAAVRGLVRRSGYVLTSRQRHLDAAQQLAALYKMALGGLRASRPRPRLDVEAIVLSKDRPMQLYALLESYFALVSDPRPLKILFRASTEPFASAYREVQAAFAARPVAFVAEADFRSDLLALVESSSAANLFFLVDDSVFINPVDLSAFAAFDTERFVPSLRHGASLRRCYTMAGAQPLPPFRTSVVPEGWLCWQWKEGKLDWAYPLSIDGHLFATTEALLMLRVSPFRNPNALERVWQNLLPCFEERLGVAYETPRIVNIPANRVQAEERNRAGRISEHELLGEWRRGRRIDVARYAGLAPDAVHMELELHLAPR